MLALVEEVLRVAVGPPGEGARGLLDVLLGVVALPEREEFHELARPVLVRVALDVDVVVEVVEHRWIAGDAAQQDLERTEGVLTQELHLLDQLPRDGHVLDRAHEVPVPEQRHPVAQRVAPRGHAVDPAIRVLVDELEDVRREAREVSAALQRIRAPAGWLADEAAEREVVQLEGQRRLGGAVQQLVDESLLTQGDGRFDVLGGGSEPGAVVEMLSPPRVPGRGGWSGGRGLLLM